MALSTDGTEFGTPYKAFVQPLRYKNKMYLDGTHSRIGHIDESHYLYVGPANVDICALNDGARLKMDNKEYFFIKKENVIVAGEIIYMWAIIRAVINEV